jgi:[ribosomal protein S18]-alanine N-acetyltransferase
VNDVAVLDMELEHIDDVLEIEELSFKTPWNRDAFIAELTKNKCAKYKVISSDNKIIAYAGMWILLDEAHITNIAVHPEYRGAGLGKEILDSIIKEARRSGVSSMTLEVRVGNTAAINLYKKYGFVEAAIRKGYYQDTNEDAIIMWKYDI